MYLHLGLLQTAALSRALTQGKLLGVLLSVSISMNANVSFKMTAAAVQLNPLSRAV